MQGKYGYFGLDNKVYDGFNHYTDMIKNIKQHIKDYHGDKWNCSIHNIHKFKRIEDDIN